MWKLPSKKVRKGKKLKKRRERKLWQWEENSMVNGNQNIAFGKISKANNKFSYNEDFRTWDAP